MCDSGERKRTSVGLSRLRLPAKIKGPLGGKRPRKHLHWLPACLTACRINTTFSLVINHSMNAARTGPMMPGREVYTLVNIKDIEATHTSFDCSQGDGSLNKGLQ